MKNWSNINLGANAPASVVPAVTFSDNGSISINAEAARRAGLMGRDRVRFDISGDGRHVRVRRTNAKHNTRKLCKTSSATSNGPIVCSAAAVKRQAKIKPGRYAAMITGRGKVTVDLHKPLVKS